MKKKYYSLSLVFLFVFWGMLNSITIIASAKMTEESFLNTGYNFINTEVYVGNSNVYVGGRYYKNAIVMKNHLFDIVDIKINPTKIPEGVIDFSPSVKESNNTVDEGSKNIVTTASKNNTSEASTVRDDSNDDSSVLNEVNRLNLGIIFLIVTVMIFLPALFWRIYYSKIFSNVKIEKTMLDEFLENGIFVVLFIYALIFVVDALVIEFVFARIPYLYEKDSLSYVVLAIMAYVINFIIYWVVLFFYYLKPRRAMRKQKRSNTYPNQTQKSMQNISLKNKRPIKNEIAEKSRKQADKAYKYYDKWYNAKLKNANALIQINNTPAKDENRMHKAVKVLLQYDLANNEIETLDDRTIVNSLKGIFKDGGIELSYLYDEFKKNSKIKEAMLIMAAAAKLGNKNAVNNKLYIEYKDIRIKKLCFELEALFSKMNSSNESDDTIIEAITGYGDSVELLAAAQSFNSYDKKDEALLTVAASYKSDKSTNTRSSNLYKEYNIRRLHSIILSLDSEYRNFDSARLTDFIREGTKEEFYVLACKFEEEGKFRAAIFTYAVAAAAGSRTAAYTLTNMAMEDTRYFISFDTEY